MLVAVGWCVLNDEAPRRRAEIAVFAAVLATLRALDLVLESWFSVGLGVLQLAFLCAALLQTSETVLVLGAQQRECAPEAAADDAFACFERRNAALIRCARAYRLLLVPYCVAHVAAAALPVLRLRWLGVLLCHTAAWLLWAGLLAVFAVRKDLARTPYFAAYRDLFTKQEPLALVPLEDTPEADRNASAGGVAGGE